MKTSTAVDVCAAIDGARLGPFQMRVLALCGLLVIIDGFDFQIIGFVAPSILREWGGGAAGLSSVFAAGIVGLVVGAFLFGLLADRIGRRPVLIASTLLFALCTLATVLASSMNQLIALRFVTGIGLGSIMPNAMALASEFSPRANRLTLTTAVSVCFPLGAVLGGLLSAAMIPHWGWRSVFYAGSMPPAAMAVIMVFGLPESIQFLVLRGQQALASRLLALVTPGVIRPLGAVYVVNERADASASVRQLFTGGRARTTALLWAVSFLNLLNLMFLSSWLPTIVAGDGLSTSLAVLAGTALQLGGVCGGLGLGRLIERFGFRSVLAPCFLVGTAALVLVGRPALPVALLFTAVTLSGLCIVGGQNAFNAVATAYYPTALRATGAGWAIGAGRLGSVAGPVLGGLLIGLGVPSSTIFLIVAVPAALSAAMVWAMSQEGWTFGRAAPAPVETARHAAPALAVDGVQAGP